MSGAAVAPLLAGVVAGVLLGVAVDDAVLGVGARRRGRGAGRRWQRLTQARVRGQRIGLDRRWGVAGAVGCPAGVRGRADDRPLGYVRRAAPSACGNVACPPGAGDGVDNVGLIVLAVALVAATAFGLWRRRTDGRLRTVTPGSGPVADPAAAQVGPVFPASDLDITLGERASLVQFSTAFCQPCRATRRVLTEVADMVDGVVAVEVDAEAHLDLVRQWDVLRTPTVFVLDAVRGGACSEPSGQPRKVDVIAALGALDDTRAQNRPVSET